MRIVRVTALVLSIVVLSYGSTTNADLLNGGFENGDLTDWLPPTGEVWVTDWQWSLYDPSEEWGKPWPDWTPKAGDYFAVLQSTDLQGSATSTLSRQFTTSAPGYVLSFDYFFDYGDYGDPYIDTAWATLSGPGLPTDGVTLFEHNTPDNRDWTTVVQPLDLEGSYTLTFGTEDYDGMCESILGVDNVNVVPVPGALLLGALGLGSAGGLLRRLRRGSIS